VNLFGHRFLHRLLPHRRYDAVPGRYVASSDTPGLSTTETGI